MTDGPSLGDVRSGLLSASALDGEAPGSLVAFKAFVFGDKETLGHLARAAATAMALPGERSAKHVATLGFAAAVGALDDTIGPSLDQGLAWLSGRRWNRPFTPPTLEADGVAMLGVALGARRASRPDGLGELASLSVQGSGSASACPFQRSMMCVAAHLFDAPRRPDLSTLVPEVRVAFAELGIVDADVACREGAWRNATLGPPFEGGAAQAVVALRAFDAIMAVNVPARLGRLDVADVVRVLGGIGRSMRSWTWEEKARTSNSPMVRWEVANEYHVQNLLWVVLAPLFPDLNAEEYAAPVGQKNPRMDLTIPSLGLVIEVKFVRPGTRFQDIIEEVAADASLYGADPKWKSLVPFIWDDSGRVEEHAVLVRGLCALTIVEDAIAVSRPGKMAQPAGRSRTFDATSGQPPRPSRAGRRSPHPPRPDPGT